MRNVRNMVTIPPMPDFTWLQIGDSQCCFVRDRCIAEVRPHGDGYAWTNGDGWRLALLYADAMGSAQAAAMWSIA